MSAVIVTPEMTTTDSTVFVPMESPFALPTVKGGNGALTTVRTGAGRGTRAHHM
jgi:hypothetical protein